MSLEETEKECSAVATAPRVSLQSMQEKIVARWDFTAGDILHLADNHPLRLLSICILQMENGFMLIGKSAPASPENFNAELGKKLAYEDCIRQLWPLEGYLLRHELYCAGA